MKALVASDSRVPGRALPADSSLQRGVKEKGSLPLNSAEIESFPVTDLKVEISVKRLP